MLKDSRVPVAIVHHANQFLITNGYTNRPGISEIVGPPDASAGLRAVLELHAMYGIPFNLHISGTFIEACAWFEPLFLEEVAELRKAGLLEIIGSAYAQNIMPLFDREHNRRQIQEELGLIEAWLGAKASYIKGFWVPERVWHTERLFPVLTDTSLSNGGFRYILADDRLFVPQAKRQYFDQEGGFRPELFEARYILDANGLIALPLSGEMRLNIPLESEKQQAKLDLLMSQLHKEKRSGRDVIAIYGDDMEKAAGIPPWNPQALGHYRRFLEWLVSRKDACPVKLTKWLKKSLAGPPLPLEPGTYRELAVQFGAGEDYMGWAGSPAWKPYRNIMNQAWSRLQRLSQRTDAAPSLLDLARKHLLACAYETGWHDAPNSVHTDTNAQASGAAATGAPAPWARSVASQARAAHVVMEAAAWLADSYLDNNYPLVSIEDIDSDGHKEVILRSEKLAAVITPRLGGRIVYVFCYDNYDGFLAVGNPTDDWNWLEQPGDFMDIPLNHPGALADHGFEHDVYEITSLTDREGEEAELVLVNVQEGSRARGLVKRFRLSKSESQLKISYEQIPEEILPLSLDIGLSPDYLRLLREGRSPIESFHRGAVRGYRCGSVSTLVSLNTGGLQWEASRCPIFGHGYGLGVAFHSSSGTLCLNVDVK